MKNGIIHLLLFICVAVCLYGCRSSRSVTRETSTETVTGREQTTTFGTSEVAKRDSSNEKHVLDIHKTDSTHIRINYDSCGRIKEIDLINRKTEKRSTENQNIQQQEETSNHKETTITEISNTKQQSRDKEKKDNGKGCSLWTFLKFMFFFLSFCLIHDNWNKIKNFIRRLWKK